MNLALYTLSIDRTSGKEAMILELVKRSRHSWTLFTSHFDASATFPAVAELDIVDLAEPWYQKHITDQSGLVLDACTHLPRLKLPSGDYDGIVVVSAGLEQFIVWSNTDVPVAALCMTPLRLAYDPALQSAYSEHRDFGTKKRLMARAFKRADAFMWRRCAGIWAISEEVKRRLVENGHVAADTVDVLYPGAETEAIEPTWESKPTILVPGRVNWTKGIETAIGAFRDLLETSDAAAEYELVVAGMVGPDDREYADGLLASVEGESRIRFVESPSAEELARLYRESRIVVFAAVNEDFGIVPIEGMAYGKPVVCSNSGGPRETVVDGVSGILAGDRGEFASALKTLVEDPELADRMGRAARDRALEFDWRHFATKADEHLEQVFGSR